MTTHSGTSNIKTKQFGAFTAAVVSELWPAVKDINPEDLKRLTENHDELKTVLKKAFSEIKGSASRYSVAVNYEMDLEEAVKNGNYDWINPNITSANFPPKGKSTTDVEVELVHFDNYITTNVAVNNLKKMGYRPAGLRELLALGEKAPDIHKEFPVVALGSMWNDANGDANVACIYRSGKARNLRLVGYSGGWYARWRFAAVRK